MKVNILISSCDEGIERACGVLLPERDGVSYKISQQYTSEKYRYIPEMLRRSDVEVSFLEGRGLSRNRNNSVRMADGDIAIIADDDVAYRNSDIDAVLDVYSAHPSLDIACFKIRTPEGEPEYKDYPDNEAAIKNAGQLNISSVEMTFRVSSVRDNGLLFDERFGIGSKCLTGGEEFVFLTHALRKKMEVRYFPYYIVRHPYMSTGNSVDRNTPARVRTFGAVTYIQMGPLALVSALKKAFLRRKELRASGGSPASFLRNFLQGVFYIMFS